MKSRQNEYHAFTEMLRSSQTSQERNAHATPIVYYGECVSVDDEKNKGRIKVYIPKIDYQYENEKERLPWVSSLFPTNLQHIPKVGETVAVIIENPWKKSMGRFWIGPIFGERTVAVPLDAIALLARPGNGIVMDDDGNLKLTLDVNENNPPADLLMTQTEDTSEIRARALEIILDSTANPGGTEYSVPYGERLVQLLEFILQTMMTHSHPPSAPPTPDFFGPATEYIRLMRQGWLTNENVRTRGQ